MTMIMMKCFCARRILVGRQQERRLLAAAFQRRKLSNYNYYDSSASSFSNRDAASSTIQEAVIVKERRDHGSSATGRPKIRLPKNDPLLAQMISETQQNYESNPDSMPNLQAMIDIFMKLEDWEQALNFEQELKQRLNEEGASSSMKAASYWRIGNLHMRLQNLVKGQESYKDALNECKQVDENDRELYGNILVALAGAQFHLGEAPQALETLQEVLDQGYFTTSSSSTNTDSLVRCLARKGLVYRHLLQFSEALKSYRDALNIIEATAEDKSLSMSKTNLLLDVADMHAALEEWDEALTIYKQLLGLPQDDRSDDMAWKGVLSHSIGKIYAQKGDYDQASTFLQTAIDCKRHGLPEHQGSHEELGKSLQALGAVYGVTGKSRQALDCFQEALMYARMKDNNQEEIMLCLRNIAVAKGEKVPKWGG